MTTELQSFDARQRQVVNTAGNLRHSEEMIIYDRGGERQLRQDSAPGKDGRAAIVAWSLMRGKITTPLAGVAFCRRRTSQLNMPRRLIPYAGQVSWRVCALYGLQFIELYSAELPLRGTATIIGLPPTLRGMWTATVTRANTHSTALAAFQRRLRHQDTTAGCLPNNPGQTGAVFASRIPEKWREEGWR